jgi:hypothetical protein
MYKIGTKKRQQLSNHKLTGLHGHDYLTNQPRFLIAGKMSILAGLLLIISSSCKVSVSDSHEF